MAIRIRLKHTTNFEYTTDVVASFNEARMSPVTNSNQTLMKHNISVVPEPFFYKYIDYFGTHVTSFDIHENHKSLYICSDSIIETYEPKVSEASISWEELSSHNSKDKFVEYLVPTSLTNLDTKEFSKLERSTPFQFADSLNSSIKDVITYSPGSTNVTSTAVDAWNSRAGVCQDFSHIMISLLRLEGIPARYISGYLYTGNGEIGEVVVGESHSWVEAWLGEWVSFDPTNAKPVGAEHIFVAHGRDYHDVSPLRGIFTGGTGKSAVVTVTLELLGSSI